MKRLKLLAPVNTEGLTTFDGAAAQLRRYFVVSAAVVSAIAGVALLVLLPAVFLGTTHSHPSVVAQAEAAEPNYVSDVSAAFDDGNPTGFAPDAQDEALPPQSPRVIEQVRAKGRIHDVNLTFYDCKNQGFCGNMSNGRKVHEGAAACSWNLPTGTKFVIVGDPTKRIYTCEDRGLLTNTWVDIFWNSPVDGWKWQASVGRLGAIDILDLPGY